jgi:hypothetical protein
MQFRLVTGGDLRIDQVESHIQRDLVQMVEFTHIVFIFEDMQSIK